LMAKPARLKRQSGSSSVGESEVLVITCIFRTKE
jgi:hypothetical protein